MIQIYIVAVKSIVCSSYLNVSHRKHNFALWVLGNEATGFCKLFTYIKCGFS